MKPARVIINLPNPLSVLVVVLLGITAHMSLGIRNRSVCSLHKEAEVSLETGIPIPSIADPHAIQVVPCDSTCIQKIAILF